jgi:hypothetical protein
MGVANSKALLIGSDCNILQRVSKEWNTMKVKEFVDNYRKGSFDFTANSFFVEKFFEIDAFDAENIVNRFASERSNGENVINLVLFLISILCIFSNPMMTVDGRLKEILHLMDFKQQRQFTKNEFVVFLFCICHALGTTLSEKVAVAEIEMQRYASNVLFEYRSTTVISFDHISAYARIHFSDSAHTCESVFQLLISLIAESNSHL